jgi:hypothetical protein
LKPFEREPVGPGDPDQRECIRTAPEGFEIDGYQGDMSSWKSFGLWYNKLSQGRQILPDTVKQELLKLVSPAASPKEKIRLIYDRLQSTTRYVSVDLGIGGWQPFEASYVCQRGYGDCKALSNYMVSMLNAVGVTAYPVLISAGYLPPTPTPEFPSNRFNHVIACVPLTPDTIWLECTSQTIPMGHLGGWTENRYALVVTPQGGVLVKTPASKCSDNVQVRKATVVLATNGGGTADIQMTYSGNQQDYVSSGLNLATPRDRDEWLRDHIEIPVFNVQQTDFSGIKPKEMTIGFSVSLELPRLGTVAGSRILFQPNLMEKRTYVPPAAEKRKYPVVHAYAYVDIDSVTYRLPDGFEIEAMPKPVALETPFARYQSALKQTAPGTLLYCRRLEVSKDELPAAQYNEYRKFLQDVVLSDKASAAIVKK